MLTFYRKEVTILQKFKHPYLLSVVEPLMENKKSLAFVTERVTHSLHSLV